MLTMTLEKALEEQAKQGYKPYNGPLLQGERFVLQRGCAGYPQALEVLANPPAALYGVGDYTALQEGLAVVGARKATPYGKACTEKFVKRAAQRGIVIISGGARGCDSIAHRAALDAGGKTVVFLGGGVDQLYPASHAKLFQRIVDAGGAVVSEREWAFPALPYTFRERNRLIAGLAKATLIVEAALPSGTFSTADDALAAGKDVLVVPGAITSPTSAGSNRLLAQGAFPLIDDEGFEDVMFRVFGLLQQQSSEEHSGGPYSYIMKLPDGQRDLLLEALAAEPMRLDDMLSRVGPALGCDNPLTYIQIHLTELEGQKLIARYPDGRYGPCQA